MAPRTITIHDGREVEDLRGLTRLWKRLKEAAGIVTAAGVLFSGIVGGGRLAIKWAGLATSQELADATADSVARDQAASKRASEDKAALLAAVAKIQATADTTAAAVARLEKHRAGTRRQAPGEQ